jgi:hypothetical protein
VEEIGDLLGYATVYYHPQVTANVLLFHNMANRFKSVVYIYCQQDAFIVTRDDDTTFTFGPSKEGLRFFISITASTETSKKCLNSRIQWYSTK